MEKKNYLRSLNIQKAVDIENEFWDYLSENAYPLTKGRLRVPISLEPFLISASDFSKVKKYLIEVISAIKKLGDAWYTDEELRKVVKINPSEEELVMQQRYEPFVGIIRVDLFYSNTPKMVEINTDYPDGFFMHDVTIKAINKIVEDTTIAPDLHARLFTKIMDSIGIGKEDHIFVGYDGERFFKDEFALTGIVLRKMGYPNVSVGAFEDLEFKENSFYFQNRKIDVIRRGAELFKIRTIPNFLQELISTQKASKIKIINNFKMRLLGHKSMMAALWDKRFSKYLSSGEREAIKRVLPKTLKIESSDIDLLPKDKWVLKPSDLAEGNGITVGSAVTDREWRKAIEHANTAPEYWILQEKVEIPETVFNFVDTQANTIQSVAKKYDFNPHIILTRDTIEMGEILVRFSDESILNVMKGGGLTYCFVKK